MQFEHACGLHGSLREQSLEGGNILLPVEGRPPHHMATLAKLDERLREEHVYKIFDATQRMSDNLVDMCGQLLVEDHNRRV